MTTPRRKKDRPWNPEAYAFQAYTPADRLPEGDLVFFLLDIVAQLDLDPIYASCEAETRGQPPFDPALLVCLLLYANCVGVYSSRKMAQACERNLAFLTIVGDDRPDFRTLSNFRKGQRAGVELPKDEAGQAQKIPATLDSSFFSAAAVGGLEERGFESYRATQRQKHHQAQAALAEPLAATATATARMAAKVATPQGRALYARRKVIVEPVFGQIRGYGGSSASRCAGWRKSTANAAWCA